jgi:protease I
MNFEMEDEMELKGKKVIILVEQMFNDLEFWYPYYRLKEAGARVVVVGSGSAEEYTGKSGTQTKVGASADQISASEFDGIIIPGGYAPDHMRRYPKMVELVKNLFEAGKVVAAICHAGWMLASADILEGRKVLPSRTTWCTLVPPGWTSRWLWMKNSSPVENQTIFRPL